MSVEELIAIVTRVQLYALICLEAGDTAGADRWMARLKELGRCEE